MPRLLHKVYAGMRFLALLLLVAIFYTPRIMSLFLYIVTSLLHITMKIVYWKLRILYSRIRLWYTKRPRFMLCQSCWQQTRGFRRPLESDPLITKIVRNAALAGIFMVATTFFNLLEADEADGTALVDSAACEACRLNREAVQAFGIARYGNVATQGPQRCTFESSKISIAWNMLILADVDGVGDEETDLELEIVTPSGQDLYRLGHRPVEHVAKHSDSTECFDRLRGWIKECLQKHPACRGATKQRKIDVEGPRRLIDTGPLDAPATNLRLIDWPGHKSKEVRYCALSYSWGPDPRMHFTTTAETYEQRTRGFQMEQLPKTLRDAVEITRQVGCRYLWIDAICIIQRDRPDWEAESPRMHLIYGNAYLVIAATENSSPGDGIFKPRPPITPFEFRTPGRTYQLGVRERADHSPWRHTERIVDSQPCPRQPALHTRSWTYQERILATRIVHYTKDELVWECNSHCYCECGDMGRPVLGNEYGEGRSLKSHFEKGLGTQEAWKSAITHYSVRNITNPSDKLPALSGLANRFASPKTGKYLAGMWSSQLPDTLAWFMTNPAKPEMYRAPSWSWASLDGEAVGLGREFVSEGKDCVTVLEAECTPAGEDPFGAVSDGYIILEGEFAPLDADEERWALKIKSYGWSLILQRSTRVEEAWERVDGDHVQNDVFTRGKSIVKIV